MTCERECLGVTCLRLLSAHLRAGAKRAAEGDASSATIHWKHLAPRPLLLAMLACVLPTHLGTAAAAFHAAPLATAILAHVQEDPAAARTDPHSLRLLLCQPLHISTPRHGCVVAAEELLRLRTNARIHRVRKVQAQSSS